MKSAAVFFDRDNTLILNDGYLGDPAGVILAPGAAAAVARAHELGYRVITASNQSGVARGIFSEQAVVAVNAKMDELLLKDDPRATIDRHEFCPFHPQAVLGQYRLDSDLRKPKPGMLLRAAMALDLDLTKSWLIGDAARDIEAAHAAGCRAILLRLPQASPPPAAETQNSAAPQAAVSSLAAAMDFIAQSS